MGEFTERAIGEVAENVDDMSLRPQVIEVSIANVGIEIEDDGDGRVPKTLGDDLGVRGTLDVTELGSDDGNSGVAAGHITVPFSCPVIGEFQF